MVMIATCAFCRKLFELAPESFSDSGTLCPACHRIKKLHELIETVCHGWRGSLPCETKDESAALRQDRRTIEDTLRQADLLLELHKGK